MPTVTDPNYRPRVEPYCRSSHGVLYFTPRGHSDRRSLAAAPATFPNPLIGPRQRRPHSIHIISYPVGFIPRDLRPVVRPPGQRGQRDTKGKRKSKSKSKNRRQVRGEGSQSEGRPSTSSSLSSVPPRERKFLRVIDRLRSLFHHGPGSATKHHHAPPASVLPTTTRIPQVTVEPRSRPVSLLSIGRRLSRLGDIFDEEQSARQANMVEQMLRPPFLNAMPASHRNSILSTRSAKSIMTSAVTELPKPVATGSGVSCSIFLAEPNVFLSGFEHDGHSRVHTHSGTALLRGRLALGVTKNVKFKSITLKLVGRARTDWPEGIPPSKVDLFEQQSLRTQALTFFHAMHNGWETEFGNQCQYTLKPPSNPLGRSSPTGSNLSVNKFSRTRPTGSNLTAKEFKRLSLQSVQSRSFGKGDSPSHAPLPTQAQLKGYKVFYPGTYEYNFELPIDHHQLETTKLQFGSVKWQLETLIERAGAFRPNLQGTKEVRIVRVPDQLSLEMSEPISISRQWEDQLHYDIMISGKSFPIGSKIPIAFRLTPLAKVQVHKIKVFVTESIEYWTNDRRVTRKDAGRKILLLEKTAGKPIDKQFRASEIRVVRGGELSPDEREGARAAAARRRTLDAQRAQGVQGAPQPLPEPTENILGDLDLGLESYWASTEMEMNVQVPTCEMMLKDRTLKLHPDCSWKNVNVFHWIKIVMRISRADVEDPTGKRRRHFEISIDSPFTVLNCLATQANTALPQYSGLEIPSYRQTHSCGCPDAQVIASDPSPASSTGTLPTVEINPDNLGSPAGGGGAGPVAAAAMPATPPVAHLASAMANNRRIGSPRPPPDASGGPSSVSANPVQRVREQDPQQPRPIHLIRVPSYNPPPFDADEPPPPATAMAMAAGLMSPPPNYDLIVGTPSVDGLADYFARLADYEDPDATTPPAAAAAGGVAVGLEDSDSAEEEEDDDAHTPARLTDRSGRVNVANPRTPGKRTVPSRSFDIARPAMQLSMAGVVRRGERGPVS